MAFDFMKKKYLERVRDVIYEKRVKLRTRAKATRTPTPKTCEYKYVKSRGRTYKTSVDTYEQGFTIADLARAMECTYGFIYKIAHRGDIPMPAIPAMIDPGLGYETFRIWLYTPKQAQYISHYLIDRYGKPKSLEDFNEYLSEKGWKYE